MQHSLTLACFLFLCTLFTGCGGQQHEGLLRIAPEPANTGPSPIVRSDPAGPIPPPTLPPDLAAFAAAANTPQENAEEAADTSQSTPALSYTLSVLSPDAPTLIPAFTRISLLARLADQPPATLTGLDQRLRADLGDARRLLQANGYYAGTVQGRLIQTPPPGAGTTEAPAPGAPQRVVVEVTFTPGPLYTLGRSAIIVTDPPPGGMAEMKVPLPGALPATLADVGLPSGSPALTSAVLDAVDRTREAFRDNGYPFAAVAGTRYVVDHGSKTLEADIQVSAGPFARMGPLEVNGAPNLQNSYFEALRTWQVGQVWNQSLVERYRDALRQSGLFQSAELAPAQSDNADGQREVIANLATGPERTIGGALKFNSDFGPGVQGFWENRNLTGHGDRLRLEMPIWADLQELVARYRLPFFQRPDQDFVAQAALRNEDTDAYELRSAAASAGIERRFSKRWTGGIRGAVEGGQLKDPDEPRRRYAMVGMPLSIAYDNTGSLLDATKGVRARLGVAPYTGVFDGEFSALRSRLNAQAFLPVAGEDTLVLALSGTVGTVAGAESSSIPASIRFYSGGGGSVRGYAYQSIGPRNSRNDPLGGAALAEVSAEARWRLSEEWGLVAFVDGGMVYEDSIPTFGKNMLWGAGLGLRYFTLIGPVRLDVGVPLNARDDDAPWQLYISIGQNF